MAVFLNRLNAYMYARARGFSLVLDAHAYEDEPHIDGQRLRGVVPLARPGAPTRSQRVEWLGFQDSIGPPARSRE